MPELPVRLLLGITAKPTGVFPPPSIQEHSWECVPITRLLTQKQVPPDIQITSAIFKSKYKLFFQLCVGTFSDLW